MSGESSGGLTGESGPPRHDGASDTQSTRGCLSHSGARSCQSVTSSKSLHERFSRGKTGALSPGYHKYSLGRVWDDYIFTATLRYDISVLASIAQLGEHSTEGISCALVAIERSPVRSGVEALVFDAFQACSSWAGGTMASAEPPQDKDAGPGKVVFHGTGDFRQRATE